MKRVIMATLLFLFFSSASQAVELSSSVGSTSQGGLTARAGVNVNWGSSWLQSRIGKLTGYWDFGYTFWEAGRKAGARHSLSFAPVFIYEFGTSHIKPFIELGVGLAVFSGGDAGDRALGSAFNFEDRLGAGLKIGETQKVGVRAIHYSNAGIKEPNDGIESFSLFYSHDF